MKSKSPLRLSLTLFLCFGLLTASSVLSPKILTLHPEWLILLCETASFLIPFALLHLFMPHGERIRAHTRIGRPSFDYIGFTVLFGLGLSCLGFVLESIAAMLTDRSVSVSITFIPMREGGTVNFLLIAAMILVPAFVQELFLRGRVQVFLTEYISTRQAVLLGGCITAILYGAFDQLVYGLVLGAAFSWISFALGSFWYAFGAHVVFNMGQLFLVWLIESFGSFGILSYLAPFCAVLFLFYFYIALRFAERLLLKQGFRKLRYIQHSDYALTKFVSNAASLALLFAYIARSVIDIF